MSRWLVKQPRKGVSCLLPSPFLQCVATVAVLSTGHGYLLIATLHASCWLDMQPAVMMSYTHIQGHFNCLVQRCMPAAGWRCSLLFCFTPMQGHFNCPVQRCMPAACWICSLM